MRFAHVLCNAHVICANIMKHVDLGLFRHIVIFVQPSSVQLRWGFVALGGHLWRPGFLRLPMSQLQESPEKVGPSLAEEVLHDDVLQHAESDPFEGMEENAWSNYTRVKLNESELPKQRSGASDAWRSLRWAENVWSQMPEKMRVRLLSNFTNLQCSTACSGQGAMEQILWAIKTQVGHESLRPSHGRVIEASDIEGTRQQVLSCWPILLSTSAVTRCSDCHSACGNV